MADTYAPLKDGFEGFSPHRPIGVNHRISPLSRAVLSSTSNGTVKKGHPLISAASDTCERPAKQGVNEVHTLTPTALTGGTFTLTSTITGSRRGGSGLTFLGTTAAIAYNATAADIQAALDLILGAGNTLVAGGPMNTTAVTITYIGDLSATNVAALTVGTGSLVGTSLVLTTTTGGTIGLVTASQTLIGFAMDWEAGPTNHWPRQFGGAPLNLDGQFATTSKEILIHPAFSGEVFQGCIWPTEVVAASMVGTSYSIGFNVSTDQFFIRTGDTSVPMVTVVGIPEGEIGKVGGKVDFIIKDGSSAFH